MILAVLAVSLVSAKEKDKKADDKDKPHEVTIKDMAYDPEKLENKVGQSVKWTNTDDRDHTVVCKQKEGGFKSGNLGNGDTFEQKFENAGKFTYNCTYHPRMKGTITVKDAK
ncbi:MAG TPA: cupredoxin domain-containing protein [Tepidisphaeraceae bacterium]|nr:cupredoxin domain-containing protein [Tepidisphaeraceae bacterium]